jgi:superfamily II DNA helicase RecQ
MKAFESLIKKEQLSEENSRNNMPTNEKTALTDEEKALEARLRKLRIDLASRDGITFLPAVYDNKTMLQLVRQRPKNLEELKQVRGFGPKRIERYAGSVLKTINGDTGDLASA